MKYARILMAVASEIWAMHPEKMMAMIDFLALQASGVKFDADEIEARIGGGREDGGAQRAGSVAILPVRGVLANRANLMTAISGGTSAEQLGASFDQLIADDAVKAVVLDTDSPGGTVQGMEELSSKIAAARGSKPIVAHVNGIAASAAYWVTSGADEVVLSPTAMVGSIGAQTAHDDVSAAMEKAGITRTLITSAPFKNEAASHQPLSDDARAHLQAQVNAFGAMFESRIASNRGIDPAIVRANYGQGRMVMAEQAVAQGMADGIATLDETIARLSAGAAPAKRFAAQREKRALALR